MILLAGIVKDCTDVLANSNVVISLVCFILRLYSLFSSCHFALSIEEIGSNSSLFILSDFRRLKLVVSLTFPFQVIVISFPATTASFDPADTETPSIVTLPFPEIDATSTTVSLIAHFA